MKRTHITAALLMLLPTLPSTAEKGRAGETEPTTYATWAAGEFELDEMSQPAVSGKLADPDGDGLNNLMEYALDGDPTYSDRIEVEPSATIAGNKLTMEFKHDLAKSDVRIEVATSKDLKTWRAIDSALISTRGSIEKRRASAPITSSRGFIRIQVIE